MSIVRTVARALAPLAMRSATRPMAVIPELIHEKEKREAARVDFFGQEQDIDSRYAMLNKTNSKVKAFENRHRVDGKGFTVPWDTNPALKDLVDPISHDGAYPKKRGSEGFH